MPSDDSRKVAPAAKPCPTCGKAAIETFRPFCSSRCRDVDLNRWLTGTYAIPAVDDDEDESSGGEQQG